MEENKKITVEGEKEELREHFEGLMLHTNWLVDELEDKRDRDMVFDFFYSEIEAKASRIKALQEENNRYKLANSILCDSEQDVAMANEMDSLQKKIKALQERLEAAENVLKCVPLQGDDNGLFGRNVYIPGFDKALEAYNKLKTLKP